MIPEEILLSFSEREKDMYGRQCEYGYFELAEAKDLLDIYSCHSEPHILEVIEQCRLLYEALLPLFNQSGLTEQIPDELLLAAKLHDICMGGNRTEIYLIDAADNMYQYLRAGGMKKDELKVKGTELMRLAEESGITEGIYREIRALLSLDLPDIKKFRQLENALGIYHDEIKNYIRKHHAPAGAAWVFKHAAEILERYGMDLDLPLTAALILLHSTSSTAVDVISCAKDENERLTKKVICDFMKRYLTSYEMEQILEEKYYKKMIYLASILRLADTRRQGNRMQMIDRRELKYQLCSDGTADIYRMMPWGPERITKRITHSVLLSECCTGFGALTLRQKGNGWILMHELILNDAKNQEIRELFERWRLTSYITEVDTGAFAESSRVHNVFRIGLNRITDRKMAFELEKQWRINCRNKDWGQKKYAESIEVHIVSDGMR